MRPEEDWNVSPAGAEPSSFAASIHSRDHQRRAILHRQQTKNEHLQSIFQVECHIRWSVRLLFCNDQGLNAFLRSTSPPMVWAASHKSTARMRVEPELGRVAKQTRAAQGNFRTHCAALAEELVGATGR